MLRWTTGGPGRRLGLIVHHTDAGREWAYDRESPVGRLSKALDESRERAWAVVDMKADWKRIFRFRAGTPLSLIPAAGLGPASIAVDRKSRFGMILIPRPLDGPVRRQDPESSSRPFQGRGRGMLFNSYAFALFFAALFPIYWLLAWWPRLQNLLLLGAAYYFYAQWDARFLSLLILSTVMDYGCGLWVARVEDPRRRRGVVALSMALNLGLLGYFKYYNFFADSLQVFLTRAGLPIPLSHLEVVLPIGISFYTFQSMSYVIDVYRREIPPTRNLVQFATFVSFFPTWSPARSCGRRRCCRRWHRPGDLTSSSSTKAST